MIKKTIRSFLKIFSLPNYIYNKTAFVLNKVKFKKFPQIVGRIYINNRGLLEIDGRNCVINSKQTANPIGFGTRTLITVTKGGFLKIARGVKMSNASIVCREKITIGENVYIGGGVKIFDNDFHSLKYEKRILGVSRDDDIKSSPIFIRDGAFLGAGSLILKGVTIGEKSVVGAMSVVTKSVPDGEIWAGNPAKFIKRI